MQTSMHALVKSVAKISPYRHGVCRFSRLAIQCGYLHIYLRHWQRSALCNVEIIWNVDGSIRNAVIIDTSAPLFSACVSRSLLFPFGKEKQRPTVIANALDIIAVTLLNGWNHCFDRLGMLAVMVIIQRCCFGLFTFHSTYGALFSPVPGQGF